MCFLFGKIVQYVYIERVGDPLKERMKAMTKADIVNEISESTGMTKTDVGLVVNGVLDSIREALVERKRIEIRGFGVFKVVRRAPRTARNPRTNEVVQIGERMAPVFVPSRIFRTQVEK